MIARAILHAVLILGLCGPAMATTGDTAGDVPDQDLRVGGNEQMRYFLIGPADQTKAPPQGYSLLVVMPGGDGGADFHPFVSSLLTEALPAGYLIAQPVAVKWTPNQQVIWPTKAMPAPGQKFSTEEFVEAVIRDVAGKHPLNKQQIFTLSWSSSGPAAYAISLQKDTAVTGSFIAMSVFKPAQLPPLSTAKDRPYYLYHSPEDRTCPLRMAQQARLALQAAGAKVTFVTYEGGHGWSSGDIFGDIGKGIRWLEASCASDREQPKATATRPATTTSPATAVKTPHP